MLLDNKELLDLAREGLCIESRSINLPEIDVDLPFTLKTFINIIQKYSNKESKNKPINLFITSYGGEVASMLGAIDIIRTAPVKINTIIIGSAFSAASFIAASGTGKRLITENSEVMYHQIRTIVNGPMQSIQEETDSLKLLQRKVENLMEKFSNKPARFWKRVLKKEYYLTPEQALEHGVVDSIIKWDSNWDALKK